METFCPFCDTTEEDTVQGVLSPLKRILVKPAGEEESFVRLLCERCGYIEIEPPLEEA